MARSARNPKTRAARLTLDSDESRLWHQYENRHGMLVTVPMTRGHAGFVVTDGKNQASWADRHGIAQDQPGGQCHKGVEISNAALRRPHDSATAVRGLRTADDLGALI